MKRISLIALGWLLALSTSTQAAGDPSPPVVEAKIPAASAGERMSGNFSEFGLPFKPFGSASFDKSDAKFPCNLNQEAPRQAFDLLRKWTNPRGIKLDLLDQNIIREVCVAEYMPIGRERYLVRYKGLGIANLENGRYASLYGENWHGDDYISSTYQLSNDTSVALYESEVSPDGGPDSNSYYMFIIRTKKSGEKTIQYAELTWGVIAGEDGNPTCPDDGIKRSPPLMFVSSILSHLVSISPKRDKVIFTFDVRTRSCKTNAISNARKRFIYSEGRLSDQKGQPIKIVSLDE